MALGAGRGEVGWQVLREVIAWVAVGIALGLPVTLEGGKLVEKSLYGLSANDPLSLVAACVVLAVAGVVAGYLPARRASRVDPVVALRYEWRSIQPASVSGPESLCEVFLLDSLGERRYSP